MSGAWFAFLLPAILLPLLTFVWRAAHPGSWNSPGAARSRCLIFIAFGMALGLYNFALLPKLLDASTLYLSDPSCAAGTAPLEIARAGAACRSEAVAIVRATQGRRRSSSYYYLTLAMHDGSRSNVQLGYAENWRAIWQKAAAFPGTAARAQLFEGHVVAVTTEDGLAQTTWYPPSRVNRYQTWALLGAGLLFAGLIELVFYWRSLF